MVNSLLQHVLYLPSVSIVIGQIGKLRLIKI